MPRLSPPLDKMSRSRDSRGTAKPLPGRSEPHDGGELFQQIHKIHPVAPASGDQQGGPPDDGQRQEPYPPGVFFCSYPAEEAPTLSSQQKDKTMQTVLSVNPPFSIKQKNPGVDGRKIPKTPGKDCCYTLYRSGTRRYFARMSFMRRRSMPPQLRSAAR